MIPLTRAIPERIRSAYDDALYKSTFVLLTYLLYHALRNVNLNHNSITLTGHKTVQLQWPILLKVFADYNNAVIARNCWPTGNSLRFVHTRSVALRCLAVGYCCGENDATFRAPPQRNVTHV